MDVVDHSLCVAIVTACSLNKVPVSLLVDAVIVNRFISTSLYYCLEAVVGQGVVVGVEPHDLATSAFAQVALFDLVNFSVRRI